MLIVLDNAESFFEPQGTDMRDIRALVDKLSRFKNICICITSRTSPTPLRCKNLDVPTLSMDAALDAFYDIYDIDSRSDTVNSILEELDFHPLSITLLATTARQNKWDVNLLASGWEKRQTSVPQPEHNKNLAATIELSLVSSVLQQLGHDVRALLEVVAFFPQGVDENNLSWLFPTISNRTDVFDKFCILSLTHRNNGFITMLAPLRDHLSPKDPKSSPLLCTAKDRYFTRMSVKINPDKSNFGETRWIISEEANVEHLLNVFTTIDGDSDSVWDACTNFIKHLVWHKTQFSHVLRLKVEGLPDDHRSKTGCLSELSRLFYSVGNSVERKRVLTHALKPYGERGSDREVAETLVELSDANRLLGLRKEGIRQVGQALEIFEWLGDSAGQARGLVKLASLLYEDKKLDAAIEAASRAICLIPEKGDQLRVCESHCILGLIYQSKRETKKAIHHFEVALRIASSFNWYDQLFWVHCSLGELFRDQGKFDDANGHIEQAKSHVVDRAHYRGRAMELQAEVWLRERRLEEARSEVLQAIDVYEEIGAGKDLENGRKLLRKIQKDLNPMAGSNCEFPQTVLLPAYINSPFQAWGTNRWHRWYQRILSS